MARTAGRRNAKPQQEPWSMSRASCSYCTDPAVGYDEDGELTCGDTKTCTPIATPEVK